MQSDFSMLFDFPSVSPVFDHSSFKWEPSQLPQLSSEIDECYLFGSYIEHIDFMKPKQASQIPKIQILPMLSSTSEAPSKKRKQEVATTKVIELKKPKIVQLRQEPSTFFTFNASNL
jgi:hypothetical protein